MSKTSIRDSLARLLSQEQKDAYAKGDRISEKRLSKACKMAWKTVHILNKKAADEIFETTNKKNGIMKIDLHGLHSSEAVDAVNKRLNTIETKSKTLCSSSNKGKPLLLQVITGI